MEALYFDDFEIGQTFSTRGATLTESMILEFAQRYDPQPFHMNRVAAERSIYGGLIASGFHTLAMASRLWLSENVFAACSLGSPGIDELRWVMPVRPGDSLHVRAEVLEKRPSASKPDRGILRMRYEVVNQNGEVVMSHIIIHLLARQQAAGRREA